MKTAAEAIKIAQQWEDEQVASYPAQVGRALLAHINSLASPQVTDEQIILSALERMDRARNILTSGNPTPACNWGMLDTSDLRAILSAPPAAASDLIGHNDDLPSGWVRNADGSAQPAASQEAKPVAADQFGLSEQQISKLLQGGLKPEEIGGAPELQHERVRELLHWFLRLIDGYANPKWANRHAAELAYYIATMSTQKHIDVAAVRQAGFIAGCNISSKERSMLERHGIIAASTQEQAPADKDAIRNAALDDIKIGRLIAASTGKRINLRSEEIAEFYALAHMVASYADFAAEQKQARAVHVPITVEFSRAFMDGAMEGEQREVLKNWKTVNDFLVSLQSQPQQVTTTNPQPPKTP